MALLGAVPDIVNALSDFKAMVTCSLASGDFRFYKKFTGIICDFCLLLLDTSSLINTMLSEGEPFCCILVWL